MPAPPGSTRSKAGVALLAGHGTFLRRNDFTRCFITTGISISDGATLMAAIDWDAAITALHAGELPCSGGNAASSSCRPASPTAPRWTCANAVTRPRRRQHRPTDHAILHAAGKHPIRTISMII